MVTRPPALMQLIPQHTDPQEHRLEDTKSSTEGHRHDDDKNHNYKNDDEPTTCTIDFIEETNVFVKPNFITMSSHRKI
jgi:hypothetical protein